MGIHRDRPKEMEKVALAYEHWPLKEKEDRYVEEETDKKMQQKNKVGIENHESEYVG